MIADNYWNKDKEVNISEDEYAWIESVANKVESNFMTIDLARKADGSLIIMEMGDGQVSGLQQIEAYRFYKAFENQDKDENMGGKR